MINNIESGLLFSNLIKNLFPKISETILITLESKFFLKNHRILDFDFVNNNENYTVNFINQTNNSFKMEFSDYLFSLELSHYYFKIKIDNYILVGIIEDFNKYYLISIFNTELKKISYLNKSINRKIFHQVVFKTNEIPFNDKMFDIIFY